MILFIDTVYLFTFWSIITMWILSESFVINNDMKYLENNYKDLINRHNLLLNDFNTILKDKYNQNIFISNTIEKNNLVISELNLNINYLIRKNNYTNTHNSSSENYPNSITSICSNNTIPPIAKVTFSKSCVF